jgi:23S rRNA (pseudouridine1915-N3)-methyltransferase
MKITLICVGKLKEKYLSEGVEEYAKRLSRYCSLDIIELADEKTPDNASQTMEELIKKKEGDRILKAIREDAYCIALAIEGKMLSSEELAEKIDTLGVSGTSHICFIIGGSLGLSQEVLKRADYKLSFSKMTFPHQLMRMILLEQIYRAYRINTNQPYHK